MNETNPKIFVVCLASYNNSIHHGVWIDATLDISDIQEEINNMLLKSSIPNAEEWAIHDYENFEGIEIDENEVINSVHEKAIFVEKYGRLGSEVYNYFSDMDLSIEMLEENYHGDFESELEFAESYFNEVYAFDIPDNITCYIDYQKFAHDIFINDFMSFDADGRTHVFSR